MKSSCWKLLFRQVRERQERFGTSESGRTGSLQARSAPAGSHATPRHVRQQAHGHSFVESSTSVRPDRNPRAGGAGGPHDDTRLVCVCVDDEDVSLVGDGVDRLLKVATSRAWPSAWWMW